MPIHLVGETIDKTRSHYLAQTGKLVQLMRGVYVDADDDIDQTVLAHAVRIGRYLYPNAYLSAASAVLLGPTRDGRLYLTGPRVQRTRLRALEIVQNKAPVKPSLAQATVADSLGEFSVKVSSIRQRFLEAFRLRSEHAASIEAATREAIASRLALEYAGPMAASDAVWALARENDWYREGEGAEKFLMRGPTIASAPNEAAFTLTVAWHGLPIGTLDHDGFEWRWSQADSGTTMPPVIRQTMPGRLPPLVVSLLPEGWLASVLNERDEWATLRLGSRYMSNITIAENASEIALLPLDALAPQAKYDGTIERVERALRGLSTSPDEDLLILMQRVLFAWLIADGDMHLKNMAVPKITEPGNPAFRSVRLAPVYDTLTTRVLPRLEHDRMALKLGGKDERLKRADFLTVSAIAGLRAADAHAAIDDLLERMRAALAAITLPRLPGYGPSGEAAVTRTLEVCRERVAAFA